MRNAETQIAKWKIITFMAVSLAAVITVNLLDVAGWLA
ncbi:hypothetical protein FHR70_000666 [Microvirga lupini]|uniref:Uncharacterized protein n=1 Tax=Microvirga lupini TaxID=420324 RepID=A0A7W4VIY2_9HYPH|nr:hypothetical protein [Microvirga lupini]